MKQSGFTLLELLVAISLLGLVAVGLTSGIRFGTQVWNKAEAGREAEAERQATQLLLCRTLQQLIPQSLSQEATDSTITFLGDQTRMRFIGPAPAQSAPPGLYRMEIAITGTDEGKSLVFRWQPFAGEPLRAPFTSVDHRVLLAGLTDASLSYFGNRDTGWLAAWTKRIDLPQLVRLRFASAAGVEEMLFGTYLGLPEL